MEAKSIKTKPLTEDQIESLKWVKKQLSEVKKFIEARDEGTDSPSLRNKHEKVL